MNRHLTREQPRTLLQFVAFQNRFGRGPTAKELARELDIEPAAATMRLRRLRKLGYLELKDGNWLVAANSAVTEPESARFLLAVSERAGGESKRMTVDDLLALMEESGIPHTTEDKMDLIATMLKCHYLQSVAKWKGAYRPGPQIGNEIEYIRLLAESPAS